MEHQIESIHVNCLLWKNDPGSAPNDLFMYLLENCETAMVANLSCTIQCIQKVFSTLHVFRHFVMLQPYA